MKILIERVYGEARGRGRCRPSSRRQAKVIRKNECCVSCLHCSRTRFVVCMSARALANGTGTAGLTLSQLLTFDSIIRETFTKFSYQNRPSCVGEFSKPVLSRNRKKTSLVSREDNQTQAGTQGRFRNRL